MGYSELIKNFNKIREYMRQFYVYGFRTRDEFGLKSSRSYDNEHRRVESWLSEYMQFRQNKDGKVAFMSIDSRQHAENPLYKAFKTKSFTDKDIIFHFYVLDLLAKGAEYTATDITDLIDSEYLSQFEYSICFDESTIRKKLKEYVNCGILKSRKEGKELLYSINISDVEILKWCDAVAFFSEYDPLGVIGSYITDKTDDYKSPFRFKHSYIFTALDSQIVYDLVSAINDEKDVKLSIKAKDAQNIELSCHPLRIYSSTQNGRQYLLCYNIEANKMMFVRIDNITTVTVADKNTNRALYINKYEELKKHLWGVALKDNDTLDTLKMTIHIDKGEEYIVNRLYREKRCGEISKTDDNTYTFTATVYDAFELIPWIRTFIGRIESIHCSNEEVTKRIYDDINEFSMLYGGDNDAV